MWNRYTYRGTQRGVGMGMEITSVRLKKVETPGRMKAIATITFEEAFAVHDIRVIEGNDGLFVAMPSKRTPVGEFRDIAHPINSDARNKVQAAVLDAYYVEEHEGQVLEEVEV